MVLCLFCIHVSLNSVEFVLFTQPKTGTHLLIPILKGLTEKEVYWAPEYKSKAEPLINSIEEVLNNSDALLFSLEKAPWTWQMMEQIWNVNKTKNSFLHLHAPYSMAMEKYLEGKNCINFFIKRDPRDQLVSLLNHYKNINFNDKEVELIETDEERLLFMIRHYSKEQTRYFMGWLNSPISCVLEFEKLMGEHGGKATQEDAMEQMRKIATALQVDINDKQLLKLYRRHFGRGWNFFKGKVGVWKDYFNEEHKAAIKEEIGDLLIELGYEHDLDW